MPELFLPAVGVAGVLSFVLAGAWYGVLGDRLARLSPAYAGEGRPPALTAVSELVRGLVLSLVVAGLVSALGLTGVGPALGLALALWVAFPVVLLSGSVFHERVPVALAAVHAGDWLVKLVAVTLVVTLWR